MKKTIIYIVVVLVIIAIAIFQLKKNKEAAVSRIYHYDKEQAINVQAITLKFESVENDISYSGTFEANKETKVSADIQGKITSVMVDLGSLVRKGQPLIQLDNSLLKLQLQTAEIQIEGLEADVNRYTVLAKADAIQGVQIEKTELALKSANVQQATLLEQISKTTIVAPFEGIVTAKLTEEGAFAAPGIPLLQITDISDLKFTVNVPEQELRQFEINQNYSLTADAYKETALSGKVSMTGSKANLGNSFPVQFSLKNTSDLKIKAGMFGKVQLKNDQVEKHIIIPASSVVGTNIQPQVYIIKNGKAILQNITISSRYQNNVLVSYGLTEGDVIVINGFINLFDGANVSVNN
ncbi:MAG: efflux RND transporter periplasmic adaptor subunit [Bacteroidales bacterium]|nr:efflux RND transporter periplasmic adaptor subunit [Bacteroidales bacterium]MCF8390161.1 efflux RND transporter periplasmic adaptor subunit [Bacteroidales bacterium]